MSQQDPPTAAPAEEPEEKKERVIHTRVPAVLEQELKRLAQNIRVPVSNLVRTILEDAVAVADRAGRGVEEELQRAAGKVSAQREAILRKRDEVVAKARGGPLGGVVGFQAMVLAADTTCSVCDKDLHVGDPAHLGVHTDPAAHRPVVCDDCLPRPKKKE